MQKAYDSSVKVRKVQQSPQNVGNLEIGKMKSATAIRPQNRLARVNFA